MEFRYPEESKSWSEGSDDRSEQNDDRASGRSYECVFCKRGFTTAQALGGHMNIHRKDRAKSAKPNLPASTSTKLADDIEINYAISSHPPGNYSSTEVDNSNYNYPQSQISFPAVPSCIQYSEVLCIQNQRDRDVLGGDWRRGLSLYSNPLCVRDNKEKIEDSSEDDGLDLELRLGYHP